MLFIQKNIIVLKFDVNKNSILTVSSLPGWTLEQAREYWQSIEFSEELLEANNNGFLFLKDLLDCKHSFSHIIGSKDHRLIQYKQFITLYNSLDIGEKIHGNGQLATIGNRILLHVRGIVLLNNEAVRHLNQEKTMFYLLII